MDDLLSHRGRLRILPDATQARLRELAVVKHVPDGRQIFGPDSEIDGLYGIISGQVITQGRAPDGRSFALTVLGPGEWFGEISLFDGLQRTHENVTRGDVEFWFVARRDFRDWLQREPEHYAPFVTLLCQRIRMTFTFIEDMAFRDLPARLAKRLLELAADHGEPLAAAPGEPLAAAPGRVPAGAVAGRAGVALRLSQEELAMLLGAGREAVGRHLKAWEREGWLDLEYGRVVLRDEAALRALIAR